MKDTRNPKVILQEKRDFLHRYRSKEGMTGREFYALLNAFGIETNNEMRITFCKKVERIGSGFVQIKRIKSALVCAIEKYAAIADALVA